MSRDPAFARYASYGGLESAGARSAWAESGPSSKHRARKSIAAVTGPSACADDDSQRSRIELGVPVQIIEPAVVQIVRRKQSAVAVQVLHRRLERLLRRPHVGFGH